MESSNIHVLYPELFHFKLNRNVVPLDENSFFKLILNCPWTETGDRCQMWLTQPRHQWKFPNLCNVIRSILHCFNNITSWILSVSTVLPFKALTLLSESLKRLSHGEYYFVFKVWFKSSLLRGSLNDPQPGVGSTSIVSLKIKSSHTI